jgi:para-aminobenzoate synthetase component 1
MLQTFTYSSSENNVQINLKAIQEEFNHACVFDSNLQINTSNYLQRSQIIALGATQEFLTNEAANSLKQLEAFLSKKNKWVFGYLSYDLKNEIENLTSKNADELNFPLIHFFVPEVVIQLNDSEIIISYDDEFTTKKRAEKICSICLHTSSDKGEQPVQNTINIQSRFTKTEYISAVNQLKEHIRKGDIYEVNFCQEFYAERTIINTVNVFEKLNAISKAPFTAYCKFNNRYALCASPERYIKKSGNQLISQPIKGTTRRSANPSEDELLKLQLQNNTKERSENVMIVDLVRNDLSRIAKAGTVKVNELMGVYTFKQLHQLISTIGCELKENISFTDIISNTFPMGSMTGAPKVSAMKLIDEYERSKRGLYSGAIGYITPEGDFDFNVVIRSILYNAENNYVSFTVGSAITDKADANEEYEECLLKAKAMFEVLKKVNQNSASITKLLK